MIASFVHRLINATIFNLCNITCYLLPSRVIHRFYAFFYNMKLPLRSPTSKKTLKQDENSLIKVTLL